MDRFFLNVSDFGIGGEVVKSVNERRLQRKASSYVRCLVSAMVQLPQPEDPDPDRRQGSSRTGIPYGRRRQRPHFRQGNEDRPRGASRRRALRRRPGQEHEIPRILPTRLEALQRQPPLPSARSIARPRAGSSRPPPSPGRACSSNSTENSWAGSRRHSRSSPEIFCQGLSHHGLKRRAERTALRQVRPIGGSVRLVQVVEAAIIGQDDGILTDS